MGFFSDLGKLLYEEKSSSLNSRVAESLAKIAEFYWEKIPLTKKRRVVLKQSSDGIKKTLAIEYLPETSFELMEYAKKDCFELKKRVEISLEEEAGMLLNNLHKSGNYSRFKTYVEKNLLSPEEVLIKMGYGKRVYDILKNSLNYLFSKKEQKIKKGLPIKEILKILPLFFVVVFFFVSSATSFIFLSSQNFNPILFLLFLSVFLLFYLFLY
ncbi:MAG: hypothetical protein ACP5O8_01985 [Candidatus Aenigmatarchaeota archaeon]